MATSNPVSVKKENDGDSTDGHSHSFKVKFSPTDQEQYTIYCDQPRTVLDVIKSSEHYKKKMKKCSDENIIIQLGIEDKKSIVATHFPCSCVGDNELLIISCDSEQVEHAQGQHDKPRQPGDKYSVFYIDTIGGKNTKSKELFRNRAVKKFKYLCVYGEKGMTVEEALKRDGRFIDGIDDFTLSDNCHPNSITERTQKVDNLGKKEFKICLPRSKGISRKTSGASNSSQCESDTATVIKVAHQRAVSVIEEVEKKGSSVNTEEIYELLCEQFSGLRKWMESRFPGDSFQEELNRREENFGKIQQSFNEVHRVRKLLKFGDSVCKVVVQDVCVGTGFVFFDNFILTNAHLFKKSVEGEKLREGVNVFALFNYEDPLLENYCRFKVAQLHSFCLKKNELDYAILELELKVDKLKQTTEEKVNVPPGLLKKFGPMPPNGEACIIGHPAGEVKKMDPTCIIEKENRKQAVDDNLKQIKCPFIVQSLDLKPKGIEKIMKDGIKSERVATYNTFMYHGSSGSPVFDAQGQVFGLHSGGFPYGPSKKDFSVIEYAYPVLAIFKDFVTQLKKSGKDEFLKKVEEAAKGNSYLEKILASVCEAQSNDEVVKKEPADTSVGSD